MASRRQGLRAVDDPVEAARKQEKKPPAKPRRASPAAPRPADRDAKPQPRRTGRITVYAEVTQEDRRDLTVTAAILGVDKQHILRALVREFTSDSPSPQQLDRLRELVDKHS